MGGEIWCKDALSTQAHWLPPNNHPKWGRLAVAEVNLPKECVTRNFISPRLGMAVLTETRLLSGSDRIGWSGKSSIHLPSAELGE